MVTDMDQQTLNRVRELLTEALERIASVSVALAFAGDALSELEEFLEEQTTDDKQTND